MSLGQQQQHCCFFFWFFRRGCRARESGHRSLEFRSTLSKFCIAVCRLVRCSPRCLCRSTAPSSGYVGNVPPIQIAAFCICCGVGCLTVCRGELQPASSGKRYPFLIKTDDPREEDSTIETLFSDLEYPSEILDDFLYLGNWAAAKTRRVLDDLQVGAVLSTAQNA
jgi:hypothetical protein